MTLPVGALLQNRFRIDALLGQGGMGAVYRTHDLVLNRPCALKEMVPPAGLSPAQVAQLRQQFRQEASVLANLSHPGLPRVTDYFAWGGAEVLVMDYVAGESLDGMLRRSGSVAEGQVLVWAGQLLDALAYCHRLGVIHRDIKPGNIILTPQGQAVLVDFGLAKVWDPANPQTTTMMRGMGTPAYAPPEQYVPGVGHTDARSDLYSLGATMYHALTGHEPPQAHMRFADPDCLLPPRTLKPSLSARTQAVVLKSMELSMARRFGSAEEMRAALAGRTTTRQPRAWMWLAAAVLGLLLLASGLIWLVARDGRGAPATLLSATAALAELSPRATDTPRLLPSATPEPRGITPVPSPTPVPPSPTTAPTTPSEPAASLTPTSGGPQPTFGPPQFCLPSDMNRQASRCSSPAAVFSGNVSLIWVSWSYQDVRRDMEFSRQWYHNGSLIFSRTGLVWDEQYSLAPGFESTYFSASGVAALGNSEYFPAGTYTLELWIGDRVASSGSFVLVR